jgi:alpha-1,2-mannosyltransferase
VSEAPPSVAWSSQSTVAPHPKALSSRPDLFVVRLLVALAMALPVIGILSYLITLAIDGRSAANPLITTLGAFAHIVVPTTRGDSWGYMITALEFVREHPGAPLYDTIFFSLHQKFQYPPTSLLWMEGVARIIPVTPTNLNRLNALAFVLNALGGLLLFVRVAPNSSVWAHVRPITRVCIALLALALPFVFWPTLIGFSLGQIQIWIDLLFTLALLLWLQDRRLISGITIGLACTIKPQLGLLLLWGILWRERDFIIGLTGTLLIVGVGSVVRYGLVNQMNYIDVLAFIARHGESYRANQSVNGMISRIMSLGNNTNWDPTHFASYNSLAYCSTALTSLAFMALPLWMALRARPQRPGVLDLCCAALCFTMASPIAWEHHYGITLPMYLVAFSYILIQPSTPTQRVQLTVLAISWVLVGSNLQVFDLLSATSLNFLQSYVFFGAILLLGVLVSMASTLRGQDRRLVAT